jgi:dienelactone hydrolase
VLFVVVLAAIAACGGTDDAGFGDDEGSGAASGSGATAVSGTSASSASGTSAVGAGGAGGATGAVGSATAASSGSAGGATTGVDPSNGMGGPIGPGQTGPTPLGAVIRIPAGYDPSKLAAPVLWLFNEELAQWSAIADGAGLALVDLAEYNDTNAIVAKLNESATVLEQQYNVDKARYFFAGWSAGGNIAIILASQNQTFVTGVLVFPGTGGNYAKPYMQQNQGHKIRIYYACGDQDPNFDHKAVQYEASFWKGLGYTTRFDLVAGGPHYLDEATYGVRATGWDWIDEFNLTN